MIGVTADADEVYEGVPWDRITRLDCSKHANPFVALLEMIEQAISPRQDPSP